MDLAKIEKKEQMYEGKAKKVFATNDPTLVIMEYKDSATAFNGEKKGTIDEKGIMNNTIANKLFEMLAAKGIPTHFIKQLSDREVLCKKVSIVPLEVITRNVAAGSFSKRLGVPEGTALKTTVFEISYKNDELGDPLINDYHAVAIGVLTTIFAQIGDLGESLIKRDAGVKDSSDILPGHGGMLDRFDGYIFAIPVAYYYFMHFTVLANIYEYCGVKRTIKRYHNWDNRIWNWSLFRKNVQIVT